MQSKLSCAMFLLGVILFYGPVNAASDSTAEKKTNIAVTTIKNAAGVSEGEVDLLADRLRAELFNTGAVNVMEREQMQAILKEQGFQQSGACTDEACLVEMGQLLGVSKIVTGSLGKLGGLFMVNLRIIDVKTGQIVKVVSKDIRGNIEDIVGELRPIAQELTGSSNTPAPAASRPSKQSVTVTPSSTFTPGPASGAKPTFVPGPSATTSASPAPALVPATQVDNKNKNRFGLSGSFASLFGRVMLRSQSNASMSTPSDTSFPMSLKVMTGKLIIPLGPYMNFDFGPGYTTGAFETKNTSYYGDTEYVFTEDYNIFSIATGLNYGRRFFPFKVNIGFILELSSMFLVESIKTTDLFTNTAAPDSNYFYNPAGGVSMGARAGLEYLLGPHFGINADFIWERRIFETKWEYIDLYNPQTITTTHTLPAFGFGLGANFYF
jgi:TolB-like protein